MSIRLVKARLENMREIYELQISAFQPLLERYQDYDTSPGAETIDKMEKRFQSPSVDIYFIDYKSNHIGIVRITRKADHVMHFNCIAIVPEYQGRGFAQMAIKETELLYPDIRKWALDTIKQRKNSVIYIKSMAMF